MDKNSSGVGGDGILRAPYQHSIVLPFETGYDHVYVIEEFRTKWHYTIYISIAYLAIVKCLQYMMRDRKAFEIATVLTAWNGALALFSILGMARSWEEMYNTLGTYGFYPSVCYQYDETSVSGHWFLWFALSKIWELGDTVFLALRKRPLTFLHCYHHMSVLVYTFQSGSETIASGRWFITMNFTAHAFMYTYYTVTSMGYRLPKCVSASVTTIQLTQMICGVLISCIVLGMKTYTSLPCRQSWFNLGLCFSIYVSYAMLFLNFFKKSYLTGDKENKKKKQ